MKAKAKAMRVTARAKVSPATVNVVVMQRLTWKWMSVLTLVMVVTVGRASGLTRSETDCCDNVKCKEVECVGNRTLIEASPAKCVCCDHCSLLHNESCVPGSDLDFCSLGLVCYATDETGEHGICDFDTERSDYEDEIPDSTSNGAADEADSETCDVEECESILRCPPDSRLVLDQPTVTSTSSARSAANTSNSAPDTALDAAPAAEVAAHFDAAECCRRRFAPKCICDFRQCPTATNVAVRHCLRNPNVTIDVTESCCAQVERCAREAAAARKSTGTTASSASRDRNGCANSNWLDRSRRVDAIDKRESIMEQCHNAPSAWVCPRSWFELSLRSSGKESARCCAELKCSTDLAIVCESARCPRELGFVAALLTNVDVCVCVKYTNTSEKSPINVCPLRPCTARADKCYQHLHILDAAGCPICVSHETSCNTTSEAGRRKCTESGTGKQYFTGETWTSEPCSSCRCSIDGVVRCETNNCSLQTREWVSINVTTVVACLSLAISLLIVIYIIVQKSCAQNCRAKQATVGASRCHLIKQTINSGKALGSPYRDDNVDWRMLSGSQPRPNNNPNVGSMIDRQRYSIDTEIWQHASDVSADDFVYVALNRNAESYQKNGDSHTATATLKSACTNITSSTIV